jgi:hypothetical protein
MRSPIPIVPMLAATAFLAVQAFAAPAPGGSADPETVLSTYHVKQGKEKAFEDVLDRAWKVYRLLDAVLPAPHIVAKSVDEQGRADYREIFTWRSADIPDHAPKEIKDAWAEMRELCEPRGGDGAIAFVELDIIRSS